MAADRIVEEHFWFTATTLAVNAFLVTSEAAASWGWLTVGFSTVASAYAAFLILHRSAAHAGRLRYPAPINQLSEAQKNGWHKAQETWCHLRVVPSQLLFVLGECSGALFYLVLVVASCAAVWLRHT